MFKNYLKIALRNLLKFKGYSAINISGLAVGLAACLLILLHVQDELRYDTFHQKAGRIYRVGFNFYQNGKWTESGTNGWVVGDFMKNQFAEVEQVVRIMPMRGAIRFEEKRFQEYGLAYVEEDFFELFSFPLLQGDPQNVLDEPNNVVLSETYAKKYFGDANPVGNVLDFNDGRLQFTVTGVMADMPRHSHFRFDILISNKTLNLNASQPFLTNPGWTTQWVYLSLQKNISPETIARRLPALIDEHFSKYFASDIYELTLQPLPGIYLDYTISDAIGDRGDRRQVFIFSIIAIILILIACVNYMNLVTARATSRAREVGIRKVLGAKKRQLIRQFLTESTLLTFWAFVIAVVLVEITLPFYNTFLGKELAINLAGDVGVLAAFVLIALALGIFSGSYPAFFLTAFQPVRVLKGLQVSRTDKMNLSAYRIRQILVVVQFALSIALLVASMTVFDQLGFMQNKRLGYHQDHLVFVPMQTLPRSQLDALKAELLTDSRIISAGASGIRIPGPLTSTTFYTAEGITIDPNSKPSMKQVLVDLDFFRTLQVRFVEGRDYSSAFPSDTAGAVVLNQAAVRQLGWKAPIGKWFEANSIAGGPRKGQVIGVTEDFHFESLHSEIAPIVFYVYPTWTSWLYVRIQGTDLPGAFEHIENVYTTFVKDREFTFSFVDEDVGNLYRSEEKFMQVFTVFTLLALAIASLGMLGLSAFTSENRTKEIGVRKVLGASVASVMALLSKDFVKLVLLANVIAWPLAWFAMNKWLENFAYRVEIGWWVFALAGGLALLIALLTVSTQAIRAALANPVDSLRYE